MISKLSPTKLKSSFDHKKLNCDSTKELIPLEVKVITEARKHGIEAHSFTDKFLKIAPLTDFAFSKIDSHPNARAHELIGQWLAEILTGKNKKQLPNKSFMHQ